MCDDPSTMTNKVCTEKVWHLSESATNVIAPGGSQSCSTLQSVDLILLFAQGVFIINILCDIDCILPKVISSPILIQ